MIEVERIVKNDKIYKGYAEIFHEYMTIHNLLDVVFDDSDRIIIAEHIERLLLSGSPYIIRYNSELAGFHYNINRE